MIDWQNLVVGPTVVAFGQPATIVWNGQTFNLSAVFDEAYVSIDVSDGMEITTVNPTLGINTAEVNLGGQPFSELQGARVTVCASSTGGAPAAATEYIVQEARADGHGWARLILNLVPTTADDVGAGQDA